MLGLPVFETPAARAAVVPGAATLGTTTYAVPSGAKFVASTGSDTAAGTQAAPWKTITRGIAGTPNGGTLVIRAGVYRESTDITGKSITMQPFPNEAVTMRGSRVVTGWVSNNASTWRKDGWAYQFPRQQPALVDPARPMANAPDMVFYDGNPMRQVANLNQVRGKTFFVDYATSKLYLGADPTGHTIEASYLQTALTLTNADNSVIRGMQFDRFATPANLRAAVLDVSDRVTFDNDIFMDNAMAGLSMMGSNTVVDRSTFADNGQLGLHAYLTPGASITNSRMKHNNTELFDEQVEAGGAKLSKVTDIRFEGNLFDNNLGHGLWFDINVLDATIVHNEFYSNNGTGLLYEISSSAIIAGNESWANGGAGIRVIESADIDVYNNVLYKNDIALDVFESTRTQNVADVVIRNNVLMDGRPVTVMMLDIDDKTRQLSGAQMGVTADYNAYCRTVASTPPRVADWSRANTTQALYTTVANFSAGTGNETHGYACEGAVAASMFKNAKGGVFTLGVSSIGYNAGEPLPANVASALGVTPGVVVNLGII